MQAVGAKSGAGGRVQFEPDFFGKFETERIFPTQKLLPRMFRSLRFFAPVPAANRDESEDTRGCCTRPKSFRLCTTICRSVHSTRLSGKRRIGSWWQPSAAPSAADKRDRGSPDHGAIAL